jgi:phosphoribosylformimino-5-aminoimidazole carboxamide ribotide isomerase
MADLGAQTVIYTDIRRDGTMRGPALAGIRQLVDLGRLAVIASGGIGCQDDIEAVRQTGAAGVIVGKALYEGKVVLPSC